MIRTSFVATEDASASFQGSQELRKAPRRFQSLHFLWLASLLFFFIPSSYALPFVLCVSLSDSSGQSNGTSKASCDPNLVNLTLDSSTFGTYTGSGRASNDSFHTVHLFAEVELIDYQPASYVPEVGGGIRFAATAGANYGDFIQIQGPNVPAVLHVTYDLSGSLISQGISAQLCYAFALGGPVTTGPCLPSGPLPSQFTVDSSTFIIDGTVQALNASFNAVIFNADGARPSDYSASATADLEHSIVLKEFLVTTPGGQPIQGITLTSSNAFDYPLSPLNNQPTQIPEPSALALLGLALAGMGWARRKQQSPVREDVACSYRAAHGLGGRSSLVTAHGILDCKAASKRNRPRAEEALSVRKKSRCLDAVWPDLPSAFRRF